jgi:hypothetical protein
MIQEGTYWILIYTFFLKKWNFHKIKHLVAYHISMECIYNKMFYSLAFWGVHWNCT